MSLDTSGDIENFKAIGKVFYRLLDQAPRNLNPEGMDRWVRQEMRKIYTEYELSEFYDNLGRLADESARLHQ